MSVYVNLRYDDFGFHEEAKEFELHLMALLLKYYIKATFAVVPKSTNLKKNSKSLLGNLYSNCIKKDLIEIALHGYKHKRGIVEYLFRVHGEMKGKPLFLQRREITLGLEILKGYGMTDVVSYVPPFNEYDENTLKALVENNITLISAGQGNRYPLTNNKIHYVPFTAGIQDWNKLLVDNKNEDKLVIFLFHYYNYPITEIEKLFKFFKEHNIKIVNLHEASRLLGDYSTYSDSLRTSFLLKNS